ncbi:hypothetical protein N7478_002456 [Penicillium angulare]|uniref:uncharacterized protein n=1 Tax=Penicillium angulare TaxID=116970 RepID=UPI00253F6F7D|nr:uncharacterized protein N7478_002456 [Penicillium angulare]KAJ5286770.1 hypothetical protein N7478_002456 [Penicillium angulare]
MVTTITKVRRSTPKVRTGCATCKIRRVKCDELRPKCHRCVSTGRACPGYEQTPSPPSQIKSYNIPFKVPGSRTDRELLHFYCCEAASSLSRFSETTLWTRVILQRIQNQPVIRNAVVALSCLHRDYMILGSSKLQVSAKHINIIAKSHSQLRTYLIREASTEVALICSLIFYTFECLVGNIEQALWHLDQGLTLFQRCYSDDTNFSDDTESTYGQLKATFPRLDIHASVFSPGRLPILILALPGQISGSVPVIPTQTAELSELEYALVVLQNWTLWHLATFLEYKELPADEIPSDVLIERLHLESQFQELEDVLQQLSTSPPGVVLYTTIQHQRLTLLQCETLIFHAVLLENTFKSPDDPDISLQCASKFDHSLAHISTLLSSSSNEHKKAPSNWEFTLSTNLVAMLYFICLKTTSRRILRTALSLMEGSLLESRDGLWNGSMAVGVIRRMMPESYMNDESQDKLVRLEDLGDGIVDASGGLDEAFQMLQIDQK